MRKANLSGIFENRDPEEVSNSLQLLLEATADKNIKDVNLSNNNIDDSCAFVLMESFAKQVNGRL